MLTGGTAADGNVSAAGGATLSNLQANYNGSVSAVNADSTIGLDADSRAGAPLGNIGPLVLRLPDPAAGGLAGHHLRDHHRVVGRAVDEVLGAVDRVDGEPVLGGGEGVAEARRMRHR